MDTIFFKKTIVKKLFHFFCAVALFLIGSAVFAQEAFTTVYDNGGKPIKGSFMTIGNKSDAPYNLNIPSKDPNCPVNIKWARLYWAGHAGDRNRMNQVRLVGPSLNKAISSQEGKDESKAVAWNDADYLIYRVQFTDGRDLDIRVTASQPFTGQGGWCRGSTFPARYAEWSGDNTGTGREAVLFNVANIRHDFPNAKLRFNYRTWWYRQIVSGNVSILVEGYKGGTMIKNGYDWYNSGGTKVGTYNFPTVNIQQRGSSCKPDHELGNVGDFEYDPSDGRLIWYKPDGTQYVAGQNDDIDPTKTIVNDGTKVTDDSYYYRWADVTADMQALARAGNLNGQYRVDNIYNNGGTSWKFDSGWALVVVYEDPKGDQNNLRVIKVEQGFERVGAGGPTTRTRSIGGFVKPGPLSDYWDIFSGVTLGGEASQNGDKYKPNAAEYAWPSGHRTSSNFFNESVAINQEAKQPTRGWDVFFFETKAVAPGATSTTSSYLANDGGYDAYINLVNVMSVATARPLYQMVTSVKNSAGTDISGQRIALGATAKYEITLRNVGSGNASSAITLEALLPKNLNYVSHEALPLGATFAGKTDNYNNTGRSLLKFTIPAAGLPANANAPMSAPITINVKAVSDCGALRDACSNKLEFQPVLKYSVVGPNENLEQLSYNKLTDCEPKPTTFFIDDTPCSQSANNTYPYCAAFELDGGAGYPSYKWTRQGSIQVLSTERKYRITEAGVYVLERGASACQNPTTLTFNITPRTGNDALHPLRNNSRVVERQTCNNTGLEYLQVALCGPSVTLSTTGVSLPDSDVIWYRYKGNTSQLVPSCPPASVAAEPANWEPLGTGKTFTINENQVSNNGTHFAIVLKNPGNCDADYYFRAYKASGNYTLAKENILSLMCNGATTATSQGWLKITNIPNGQYQYKIDGPSASVGWTDVPGGNNNFEHQVSARGEYTVTLRPKLAGGSSQFQNNVCTFEQKITVQETTTAGTDPTLTLTKKDVQCVAQTPSGGAIHVMLHGNVSLPVDVIVKKQAGSQIVRVTVDNDSKRDSNNWDNVSKAAISTLGKGKYEVTVVPNQRNCTTPAQIVEINELPELKLLTITPEDPTCGPTKRISMTYTGGTPPYSVWVESSGVVLQRPSVGNLTAYTFEINDPTFTSGSKTYIVGVRDANGCSVFRNITYQLQPKPTFTKASTAADCSTTAGTITMTINNPSFDVTKYSVRYAIEKANAGGTFSGNWIYQNYPNNTFTGLASGKYRLRVYYKRGSKECSWPEETYQVMNNGRLEYLTGPDFDDQIVTINEGNGPLTGFANVSHLACKVGENPTGHAHASVRVSGLGGGNGTAGGVGPSGKYDVSLDGGITWNAAPGGSTITWDQNDLRWDNVPADTYHVKIRSHAPAGGLVACEQQFTVQVESPLAAPEVTNSIAYDCEGAAQITFTTSRSDYSYHVVTGSPLSSLPTEWNGNYEGTGTINKLTIDKSKAGTTQYARIFYKRTVTPKRELIREDFGVGEPTDIAGLNRVGVSISPLLRYKTPPGHVSWQEYSITNYKDFYDTGWPGLRLGSPNWIQDAPEDHTGLPNGRYMFIDMYENIPQGMTLYQKEVDIVPNGPIGFEVYVMNLNRSASRWELPNIRVQVTDLSDNVIGEVTSGDIPYNDIGNTNWVRISSDQLGDINPGNNTRVRIKIQNTHNHRMGNDFAIDDIYVFQGPVSCPTLKVDVALPIEAGKEMKITSHTTIDETCNGSNDGKLTFGVANYGNVAYGWKVVTRGTTTQVQGGTNNTAGLTVNNLAPGLYTLKLTSGHQVKFSDNQACEVTQDFEIKRNDRVTVTQNRPIDYLDCNVERKQVLFFSQNATGANQGVFNITGGKQTTGVPLRYTIKVVKIPSGATDILTPDSNGYYRYVVGAGTYQVTITDDNNCNGGQGTFTYKVEGRHKIATLEAKYENCNATTGIGDMKLSHTFVGGVDNGKTVTYDWKKQGDATWTAVAGTSIPAATVNGWTKGATYLIRAKDEYSCEKEIEVVIPVEIEDLLAADYTVVQPTAACGATPATQGSITVNHVRGGSLTPSYRYAFVPAGQTPSDTDYATSNTKTGLNTAGSWDIYIKDIAATPPTCGKRVTTQSIKIEDPVSTDVEKIGGNFAVDSYSALCEDGQGGKLVIKKFWGKGPFEIILKDNTHNTRATYTIPKVAVPGKVTISPSGRMEVVDYALENLEAGNNYELHIKDIGNGNCDPLGATGYTFSIASMSFTYPAGGAVTQSLVGCTTTMAFALKANNNIQPAADYEVVYRLVRHNGAPVTGANGQWVTEAANPVVAPYIAQGLQGALYAGFTLGDRFTAQVGVRRKSDNSVVCTKDIPEFTLTGTPSNVNLATAPSGTCNYNLTVQFGASGVTYYDVQFFLNHDGPTAEDQSAVIGTFAGGNSHTFNNLQKGRTYKVYIHYKENSGSTQVCKQAIDVPEDTNNRPSIQVDNNTLSGVACSPGATTTVNFNITVTVGAPLNYKVYTKADSGVLTLVGNGAISGASPYLLSLPGQTITAPGQRYVLSLIDASGCESFTHDIFVTPPPTNALTGGTLSVDASTTAMSCTDGRAKLVVKGGATGGTGPFTYSLLQTDNTFLRRNIVKRNIPNFNTNVDFDLRESDFVPGTVYSGITFTFRITDQATGCEAPPITVTGNALGKFLSSQHKATATLDINRTAVGANACDANDVNYKLKITLSNINATGGTALTFADYEYSIDGGNTYTTFPALTAEVDIPALFDQNKVKVRAKESLCDATIAYAGGTPPGPNERLTYPKLKFTAEKKTDMACDNAGVYRATFNLKITSGSDFVTSPTVPAPFTGANRYEIKVTEGTGVAAGTRNALTTAPAGTTFTTAVTPAGTNVHTQLITVTYTPPLPTTPITYNVWVKDLGNKYCDDYVASAPIVINPAEDPAALKARHTIDPTKINNVVGCTPGGTTGSFEFTRTITSGREDVSFEYELFYSTAAAGPFTGSGIEVGDGDIIERTTSTVRYKVTGLKAGYYQLRVKSSANGTCGQDVTNFTGGVVQITERPIPTFDVNPANPGIEIVQAGCGAATSYGVTPKQSNAQLYLNIKGGTPPYKVEIYEAGSVIITRQVTSSTPPAPYPGPTVYTANATIDLPAKDVDYTIVVKVTDANGCVLAIPSSFVGTVKTLQKITGVTLNRTQQMSCQPTGTEQVTMTVTRTNGSNTNGYNVYIRKMTGAGAPTEVAGYDSAARTAGTAQIGGTGVGTITFPQIAEESADYEIILTDKDTGCTFVVPSGYRVEKAKAPRVNFFVTEGICGDTASPAPGTVDVTFKVEVEGEIGSSGYTWFVKKSGGTIYGTQTGHGASDQMTVHIPVGDVPQGTVVTFETEVTVVSTQCKTTAQLTATRPQNINAVSKVLRYMTYCNGEAQNDAQIGVTSAPTGGWGAPYQYRVVTDGNAGSFTDQMTFTVGVGTHYIEVRDSRGCTRKLDSFTFVPYHGPSMQLQAPNAPVATKKPSCVGSQDGEIKLTGVTGGSVTATTPSPAGTTPTLIEGKLSYELFDATTNTSLGRIQPDDNPTTRGTVTFSGLGAGKYFIRITSDMLCADDKHDTQVVTVNDPGTIIARAELTKYPGCATAGDITVQIEGRPNMDPARGTYKVELYDISAGRPGTLVPGTPTITGAYQTGVTAVFATAVASGPTSDKVYYAKVMDNGGGTGACEGESNEVHVAKVNPIDGAIDNDKSVTSLKCYGSSYGKIVVTATGGKNDEPYVFTLKRNGTVVPGLSTPNPNAQGVFEGLAADDYSVEISQAVGVCTTKVFPVKIEQETEYKVQYEVKQVTCNGDHDGSIEITTTSGQTKLDGTQRKLTYAISPRLDRFLDNGGKFEGLAPGKYYVIVQDENGCRPNEIREKGQPTATGADIIEFTITEPDPLSVTVRMDTVEHESCAGSNDGKAYLRVIGGTPFRVVGTDNVYQYSKDGGATWVEYHSDGNGTLIDGLAPGDHTINIRDKNGCQAEATLTIEAGSEVTLKLSQGKYECVNNVIKYVVEASVEPASAALNVRYLLDGVAHNNTRFELDVDLQTNTTKSYVISVIHKVAGHGECRKDSAPIVVAPKTPLKAQADKITSVSCHDGADGSFEVVAQGGSGKYEYGLKQADGSYRWQGTNNQFKNLSVGSYTVGVKDTEYGCIYEVVNTAIIAPTPILITQNSITHVGCKGEANGEIEYVLKGGNPQYSWEVFFENGESTSKRGTGEREATPFKIQGLKAGKYLLVLKDAKGCSQKKEFEIIEGVDLKGVITQHYQCNADISENNKVLVVDGSGPNSDTAAEATYDVYVSVTTPYLVINPSSGGAINRLRYAITTQGGSPIQRYEFNGTTPGTDNTHNMYKIAYASLLAQLNAVRPLQEGLNKYELHLYYFNKDNPAMSDPPLCQEVRELNIEYYPPIKITNQSIANDLNLVKVKVEGGKERYTVYFSGAQYHTGEEVKAHYVQKVDDVKAGDEVVYYVQKTDYEEVNPATGKVEKKVRVYVEDSKGELKEENGGKQVCAHSVFIYKEYMDVVIPNYFTPNGDGEYDTWAPLNLASYPHAETIIYDRYGRQIATLNNRQEWDGTYGGEPLPTGDYWYVLRLNEPDDSRTFKGHFTLYR